MVFLPQSLTIIHIFCPSHHGNHHHLGFQSHKHLICHHIIYHTEHFIKLKDFNWSANLNLNFAVCRKGAQKRYTLSHAVCRNFYILWMHSGLQLSFLGRHCASCVYQYLRVNHDSSTSCHSPSRGGHSGYRVVQPPDEWWSLLQSTLCQKFFFSMQIHDLVTQWSDSYQRRWQHSVSKMLVPWTYSLVHNLLDL